jgi:hypothetical protein
LSRVAFPFIQICALTEILCDDLVFYFCGGIGVDFDLPYAGVATIQGELRMRAPFQSKREE